MQLLKGGHDLAVRLAAGKQLWAGIQESAMFVVDLLSIDRR